MQKIFLDHASTTPLHPTVADTMYEIMTQHYGNPSSTHSHGRSARTIIEQSRRSVANSLNTTAAQIYFASSATEAINTILKNCVWHLGVDTIISSPTEHHCVLRTIDYLTQTSDVHVKWLSVDSKGNISTEELETFLAAGTKSKAMVSLMHGNNEIGTIHDIVRIGDLCSEYGAYFHCDAVQTVGKLAIDLQSIPVDFLTASAHKFQGPKGVGLLYKGSKVALPTYIHGGKQEREMRAGTENIYGIAGLAKALEIAHTNLKQFQKHTTELRIYMKTQLQTHIPGVQFNGNQESDFLPHILSVSFPESSDKMLLFNLDIAGISASSGSACSSGAATESHVLKAIGHPNTRTGIRFSFGMDTSITDIDNTITHLVKLHTT